MCGRNQSTINYQYIRFCIKSNAVNDETRTCATHIRQLNVQPNNTSNHFKIVIYAEQILFIYKIMFVNIVFTRANNHKQRLKLYS